MRYTYRFGVFWICMAFAGCSGSEDARTATQPQIVEAKNDSNMNTEDVASFRKQQRQRLDEQHREREEEKAAWALVERLGGTVGTMRQRRRLHVAAVNL